MTFEAIIDISGEISEARAGIWSAQLLVAARRQQPVTVSINSQGGMVAPALKLAGEIRAVRGVVAVVEDRCDSAAIIILAAARFRYMRPGARLLLHEFAVRSADFGSQRLTAELLGCTASDLRHVDRLFRQRCAAWMNISPDLLGKLERDETTISAQRAVALGLAHGVME